MINKSAARTKKKSDRNFRRRKRDVEEAELDDVVSEYTEFNSGNASTFAEYPLSRKTKAGLREGGFVEPTEIQRECIGLALRGFDILGAAKTGSGKTLAFIVPVLECLWRNRWSQLDGLGALIISPTRELALQTFEVLVKFKKHDCSAGLIIGGTSWEAEKASMRRTNILVSTPGRLLQHMDENPGFDAANLQMLVMDEADRLLDMGFQRQLNAIIQNLPNSRQTLLFSATQTKSVGDLARLSLVEPLYISVHEHSAHSTPDNLVQSYTICADEDKMNFLWSFLRNHSRKKMLVFLATCKQVRFVTESLSGLRPGMAILALHGSLSQQKRMETYRSFCGKENAALVATDVAARGLDFPAVDWVLQLDCPPDATEYIHRSGRTARFRSKGESLLLLTPSQETAMIQQLIQKKVPISQISVNPDRIIRITGRLEALCAKDQELKSFAQKAYVAYVRSVFLMRNKAVFDVQSIKLEQLAQSVGLAVPPRIRFLRQAERGKSAFSPGPSWSGLGDEDVQDDQLLTVKQEDIFHVLDSEEPALTAEPQVASPPANSNKKLSKAALAKKLTKKKIPINKRQAFQDDSDDEDEEPKETAPQSSVKPEVKLDLAQAMRRLQEEDVLDKKLDKEKRKARKLAKKLKRKRLDDDTNKARKRAKREEAADGVELGTASDSDEQSLDLSWLPHPDRPAHSSLASDQTTAFKLLSQT